MNPTTDKSIADTIINGLKKAVVELEEFRVQAALGKAEAHDAFEAAKKNLRHFMHETEQRFSASEHTVTDVATELKAAIETLQVQLALGKAETRDLFEAQRKKIMQALHTIENFLENNKFTAEYKESINREIQKFKIKLEILKLRYELNKIAAHEEFEQKKKEFSKKLDGLAETLRQKEKTAEKSWGHFKADIAAAYGDMKKAFVG
jgi:DNA-binding ferritin-like protein